MGEVRGVLEVLGVLAGLARELKLRIYQLAKQAASKHCRGLGRFNRKEFAQFLKIAISSEHEVRNHIIDAFDRGYVGAEERDGLVRLSQRSVTAAARLRRYLLSDRNPFN